MEKEIKEERERITTLYFSIFQTLERVKELNKNIRLFVERTNKRKLSI